MMNYTFTYSVTAKCYHMGQYLGTPEDIMAWPKLSTFTTQFTVDQEGWLTCLGDTPALAGFYRPDMQTVADYSFTVPVIAPQVASGGIGVCFRVYDRNNYYYFMWDQNTLGWERRQRLVKVRGGVPQILAENTGELPGGYLQMISVELSGNRIVVKVNEQVIFDYTDMVDHISTGSCGIVVYKNKGGRFAGVYERAIEAIDLPREFDDCLELQYNSISNSKLVNGTAARDLLHDLVAQKRSELNVGPEGLIVYAYTTRVVDPFAQTYFDTGEPVVYTQYGNYYTYAYLKSTPRVPEVPLNFRGTVDNGYIRWSWNDVTAIENGYKLYDTNGNLVTLFPSNSTQCSEPIVDDGITVTRRLVAYNRVGESAPTDASVYVPVTRPGSPAMFTGLAISANAITWVWSNVLLAQEYELVDQDGNIIASLPAGTSSYKEEKLKPATSYTRGLRAVRKGLSGETVFAAVETSGGYRDVVPMPHNFTGEAISKKVIRWSWECEHEVARFVLLDIAGTVITVTDGTGRSYIEYELEPGASYTRILVAEDSAGHRSIPVTATVVMKDGFEFLPCEELPELPRYVDGFASGIGDMDDLFTEVEYGEQEFAVVAQAVGTVTETVEVEEPATGKVRFKGWGTETYDVDYGQYELTVHAQPRQDVEFEVTAEVVQPVSAEYHLEADVEYLKCYPMDIPFEADIVGYVMDPSAPALEDTCRVHCEASVVCKHDVPFNYQLEITYVSQDPSYKALVDIVWIIDYSGSMDTYMSKVTQNASSFVDNLNANNIDFRLAVVAYETSAYKRTTSSGLEWTTSAGDFASMVQIPVTGGTENGIGATLFALNNYSFRSDALKYFVILTDEDADDYGSYNITNVIDTLKINNATFSCIYNPNNGYPYPDMANGTGGTTININNANWGANLATLVNNIRASVTIVTTLGSGQDGVGILQATARYGTDYTEVDPRALYQIVEDFIASGQSGLPQDFLTSGYNTITSYRLIPPTISGIYASLSNGSLTSNDGGTKIVAYSTLVVTSEQTFATEPFSITAPAGCIGPDTAARSSQTCHDLLVPTINAFKTSDPQVLSITPVKYWVTTGGALRAFTGSPNGFDYVRWYRTDYSTILKTYRKRIGDVLNGSHTGASPLLVSPEKAADLVADAVPAGLEPIREFAHFASLGWRLGSTPFDGFKRDTYTAGVLEKAPSVAYFVKDIYLPEKPTAATIYIASDDGMALYVNGVLIADRTGDAHGWHYWDYTLDIAQYLIAGRNRIAVLVDNGYLNIGSASGSFDCELAVTLGGTTTRPILRGAGNYGEDKCLWWYYGLPDKVTVPSKDTRGLEWYAKDYGLLNLTAHRVESLTPGAAVYLGTALSGKWSDWGEWRQWDTDPASKGSWTYDQASDTIVNNANQNGFSGIYHSAFFYWRDYTVEAEFWVNNTSDDDGVGIVFRWQDEKNFYYFMMDNGSVNKGLGYPDHMRLARVVNGQHTTLGAALNPHPWVPNQHYHVRVEMAGQRIRVWVNGTLQYDVEDNSLSQGTFGPVTVSQAGSCFANFKAALLEGCAYAHLTRTANTCDTPVTGDWSVYCRLDGLDQSGAAISSNRQALSGLYAISGPNTTYDLTWNTVAYLACPEVEFHARDICYSAVTGVTYSAYLTGSATASLNTDGRSPLRLNTTTATYKPQFASLTVLTDIYSVSALDEQASAENPQVLLGTISGSQTAVHCLGYRSGPYDEKVEAESGLVAKNGSYSLSPDGKVVWTRGWLEYTFTIPATAVYIQFYGSDSNDGYARVYIDEVQYGPFLTLYRGHNYIYVAGLPKTAHTLRVEAYNGDLHVDFLGAVADVTPAAIEVLAPHLAAAQELQNTVYTVKQVRAVSHTAESAVFTAADGSSPVYGYLLRPSRYYTTWEFKKSFYAWDGNVELVHTVDLKPMGRDGIYTGTDVNWEIRPVNMPPGMAIWWENSGTLKTAGTDTVIGKTDIEEVKTLRGTVLHDRPINIAVTDLFGSIKEMPAPRVVVEIGGAANVYALLASNSKKAVPGAPAESFDPGEVVIVGADIIEAERPCYIYGPWHEIKVAGKARIRIDLPATGRTLLDRIAYELDTADDIQAAFNSGGQETNSLSDELLLTGTCRKEVSVHRQWRGSSTVHRAPHRLKQGEQCELDILCLKPAYDPAYDPAAHGQVEDIRYICQAMPSHVRTTVKQVKESSNERYVRLVIVAWVENDGMLPWTPVSQSGFYYYKGEERYLYGLCDASDTKENAGAEQIEVQCLVRAITYTPGGGRVIDIPQGMAVDVLNDHTVNDIVFYTWHMRDIILSERIPANGLWHNIADDLQDTFLQHVCLDNGEVIERFHVQPLTEDIEVRYDPGGSSAVSVRAKSVGRAPIPNMAVIDETLSAVVYPLPAPFAPLVVTAEDGTPLRYVYFPGEKNSPPLENVELLTGDDKDTLLLGYHGIDPDTIQVRIKPHGSAEWFVIRRFQLCRQKLRLPVTVKQKDLVEVRYRLKDSFTAIPSHPAGGVTIFIHSTMVRPGDRIYVYYETNTDGRHRWSHTDLNPLRLPLAEGFITLGYESNEPSQLLFETCPETVTASAGNITISLLVLNASGSPLNSQTVTVSTDDGQAPYARTDKHGRAVLRIKTPAAPGVMEINAFCGGLKVKKKITVLEDAPPYRLDIMPEKDTLPVGETATVLVSVYDRYMRPAPEQKVVISCLYGSVNTREAISDCNGEAAFAYTAPLAGDITDRVTIVIDAYPNIKTTVPLYVSRYASVRRTVENMVIDIPEDYSINRLGLYDIDTLVSTPPEWL